MNIEKVSGISYEKFMENHCKARVPLVFKNASKDWKAHNFITPEYLKEHFSERSTLIGSKEYTIREILEHVAVSTPENPAPYPAIFEIRTQLPEILQLIHPLNMGYAIPNWFESNVFLPGKMGNSLELFIGGVGCQFPFAHIDQYYTNAWITQVYGEKQITLFPDGQDEMLYPKPENPYVSEVNIFNPDYKKHPKFKYATPITTTILPGETLFIPHGTWHTAQGLTTNISIIFDQINQLNFAQWKSDIWHFKKQNNLLNAVVSYTYATAAGAFCRISDLLGKN
jgi:ribosomal protein L16 Arg81 hydroxylase